MADSTDQITTTRQVLSGIDAMAFQHPLDRQATDQLKRVRGFDKTVAKFIELGVERVEYVINIASGVRVGPNQFPKIYQMLRECCVVLDVPEPELYVGQGAVNSFTSGHTHPYIVLETGLLELFDDDEIMAALAHEVGHIKCNHVLYKTMARAIEPLIEIVGDLTLGIGALIGVPIQAGLAVWDRRSELSADRAALLVMQDVRPCIGMLMKLAGGVHRMSDQLDEEQFLNQARAYGELDRSMGDQFYRLWASLAKSTHPFAIERAKALNDWIDTAEFEQILAGNYARIAPPAAPGKFCKKCGTAITMGTKFCGNCGQPVPA